MIYLITIILSISVNPTINSTRQLLLFTSPIDQRAYLKQINLLNSDQAGLDERNLKIKIIGAKDLKRSFYKVKDDEFCLILIGKDGTEKYRTNSLLTLDKLYSLIDAMPMRKQEMKNKSSSD